MFVTHSLQFSILCRFAGVCFEFTNKFTYPLLLDSYLVDVVVMATQVMMNY